MPRFTVSCMKLGIFLLHNNLLIYQILCTLIHRRRSLNSFSLFHIHIICSFQIATHLQYGFHFNKCIAGEQIAYFALNIKKLAIITNKLALTIRSVPFYQWSHAVSVNQLGPLLSIWRKIDSPISGRKRNPPCTHETSKSYILVAVSWMPVT